MRRRNRRNAPARGRLASHGIASPGVVGPRGPSSIDGEPVMHRTLRTALIAAALTSGAPFAPEGFAQTSGEQLGTVHFATSCTPEAQKLFDRAMLYQHS